MMAIVDDLGRVNEPIDKHWSYNRRVINANGDLTPYQMYVQNFGVLGDGATDNTATLQEAINAACSVGGALVFPRGKYVTGPLTIGATGSYQSCALIGERVDLQFADIATGTLDGSVLSLKKQGNGHLITVPPANASDVGPGPPLISDMWLDGNSSQQTGSYWLIDLPAHTATGNKCRAILLDRIRGGSATGGGLRIGLLRNAGYVRDAAILGTSGPAVQMGSCNDWRFFGGDLWSTGANCFYSPGGGSVTFYTTNFFSSGTTHGVKIDASSSDHSFFGCSFDRNARNGIYVLGTTGNDYPVSLVNCRFTINSQATDNTYADITCDGPARRVQAIGCTFQKSSLTNRPDYCVETLNGADGVIVVGSHIRRDAGGLEPFGTAFTNDTSKLYMIGDEITGRNFFVDYDPGAVNRGRVKGGQAGNPVVFGSDGEANAGTYLYAQGSGNLVIGRTTNKLGFYGVGVPRSQLTVTGAKGGNAALTSLLTQLAALGLIVDGST
jgi:hypothetical protein